MVRDVFGKTVEEVVLKDEADLHQLIGAEVIASELLVEVLPRAAHLLGEPCHVTLLPGKLGLDEVSDMGGFVHKNGVNPFVCFIPP